MHTRSNERTFLPAAGFDWLLPLYDPFVRLAGGEAIRKGLIHQAVIQPGHKVLEIGCGTGEVLLAAKLLRPDADVTGLDPDPKALERAKQKAARKRIVIHLDQGFSDELPYPDQSFDRVLSSLMFHHLSDTEKEKTLREARRVLKTDGTFHLVDFEKPEAGSLLMRLFHSGDHLKDNSASRILTLLREAGFSDPQPAGRKHLLFFHVAFFRA